MHARTRRTAGALAAAIALATGGTAAPAGAASAATSTAHLTAESGTAAARVGVRAPKYDSPGGMVAVIATAPGARSFSASVPGGRGECSGPTWRHADGVSQRCWITLPRTPGTHTITVRARLSGNAQARGTARIVASGPRTSAVSTSVRDRTLNCGNTTRDVWLTFDDGFTSTISMRRMLAALKANNVRARFFATGTWARSHPAMVRELQRAGHIVENHTSTHQALSRISDSALRNEIGRGPATRPHLVRPGYGAGAYTTRVADAAAAFGQRVCHWGVDPSDYAGASATTMTSRVLRGDRTTPPARAGSVVLMHMTGRHTTEALPGIIRGLRAKGLTLPRLR